MKIGSWVVMATIFFFLGGLMAFLIEKRECDTKIIAAVAAEQQGNKWLASRRCGEGLISPALAFPIPEPFVITGEPCPTGNDCLYKIRVRTGTKAQADDELRTRLTEDERLVLDEKLARERKARDAERMMEP